MKNFTLLAAGALLLGIAPTVFAQSTNPVQGEMKRASETAESAKDLDRPSAPTKIVVPQNPQNPQANTNPNAPSEVETPPIESDIVQDPPTEVIEPPTFFGETVSGKFVFTLDRSGSMMASDSGSGPIEGSDGSIISNPSRIAIVKSECIKVLTQLTEEDKFAIVTFGSSPDHTHYPEMVYANSGAKQTAITFVQQMVANGWTPAYHALELSCQYDNDTNKLFFLCDGGPNAGGGASAILAAFPGWFQAYSNCTLVCVHIGTSGEAASFMQALAAGNNGIYIHK